MAPVQTMKTEKNSAITLGTTGWQNWTRGEQDRGRLFQRYEEKAKLWAFKQFEDEKLHGGGSMSYTSTTIFLCTSRFPTTCNRDTMVDARPCILKNVKKLPDKNVCSVNNENIMRSCININYLAFAVIWDMMHSPAMCHATFYPPVDKLTNIITVFGFGSTWSTTSVITC